MSWTSVNLSDVPTGRELLPDGKYTFQVLPGAKFSQFDPNKVEFPASVVGGEFNGRRVFVSYPDPDKQEWSLTAFKRLTVALGVEIEAGEGPIAYLNRVTGMHFQLPVSVVKDAEGVERQRLNILNPSPAKA